VNADVSADTGTNARCRFAPRCPSAMQMCWEQHPPFFQRDEHRVVACYLNQAAPVAKANAVDEVFVHS
jgi:ABC-type dipeptide/oligopeptide/nickel transport system ATPase component